MWTAEVQELIAAREARRRPREPGALCTTAMANCKLKRQLSGGLLYIYWRMLPACTRAWIL